MKREELLETLSNHFQEVNEELSSSAYEKKQNENAIIQALLHGKTSYKLKVIINLILKWIGSIPAVSVDEFRTDQDIKKKLRLLEEDILVLNGLNNECVNQKSYVEKVNTAEYLSSDFENVTEKEPQNAGTSLDLLKKGYIAIVVETLDKGGVEQVIAMLAAEFVKRRLEVRILCLKTGGFTAQKLEKSGIEVVCFQDIGRDFKKYIRENPPVIVNTHYVKRYINFLYKQRIPVVEVIHNMYLFYDMRTARKERQNERYFSKLIAVSQIVKDTYRKRIIDSDKIEVIGNAAALRGRSEKNCDQTREYLGIPKDAFVLINVGSIDRRKNQVSIIRAFNIVSQLVDVPLYLVLAGNTLDEKYECEVKELINSCTYSTHICLLPYYDKISEIYQMADVMILNSYYEGWSIAATEALYEGLPVIHSYCGSAVELIRSGENGIVIPNPINNFDQISTEEFLNGINCGRNDNLQELVVAILKMVEKREYWKKHREIVSEKSRALFSIDGMIDHYLAVFSEIIGKRFKEK